MQSRNPVTDRLKTHLIIIKPLLSASQEGWHGSQDRRQLPSCRDTLPSLQRCGGSCTWPFWSSSTSSDKYGKQDLKSVFPSLPLVGILECPGPRVSHMPGSVDSDQLLTMHVNTWAEELRSGSRTSVPRAGQLEDIWGSARLEPPDLTGIPWGCRLSDGKRRARDPDLCGNSLSF